MRTRCVRSRGRLRRIARAMKLVRTARRSCAEEGEVMKAFAFALVLALVLPVAARAQSTPAGVVTRLEGTVTAVRASLPQPVALKFKDGVFVNDRIVTGDQSVV